ncbi:1-acyl-sn-glycerol-3-phosphate acyltransferase [Nakamurella sp. UYEF19]|uniref:lysophospholipid acyltransferase family protein n=1 Tax=Nakamurella sp. UYEF19 TaxID=1756392 RepID=UPI003397D6A5
MQDRVYRVVIRIFRGFFRLMAIRFDIRGGEYLPASGPAVIASNHISYLDFTFIGLAADNRGRKVRFLAKRSIFGLPVVGSLMRAMGHVPVERASGSGAGAYRHAERALQGGEIVGVFPEATISRAWTLKPFKRGAAALAVEEDVPLLPVITWGGQRLITVDGRRHFRRHVPVTVLIGPPIPPRPDLTIEEFTDVLHAVMDEMLDGVQRDYPDRPRNLRDTWWLPRHLGGSAPDPAEAAKIDEAKIQR